MKPAALVRSLFALSFAIVATVASCGGATPPAAMAPAPAAMAPAPAAMASAPAAMAPAPAAPSPASADAAVARLLGGWAGAGDSPFGEMPFAALFERQPDGGVRSWLDDGAGSAIDLHLWPSPDGWRLREQATLPKLGTQAHTLQLSAAEASGDRARLSFTHPERPGFLDIELEISGDQLVLTARLRGAPHVHFTMKRLPQAALPALAASLHPPGTRPPTAADAPAPSARSTY